jgi:acetoin utilization protein AcuC
MSDRTLAFIYSPDIERLSYPPDCPFTTQRARLTRQRLKSLGLLGGEARVELPARKASWSELQAFHSPAYLRELQRAAAGDLTVEGLRMGIGGPDTPVFGDLFEYGAWACGAGLNAVELLLAREADIAFNLQGGFHHAMAERAAGFCYLNDVVLACMRLADAGKRVACLDVDAHHGDGTQSAFYRRDDVLTISMHESGKTLFPWGGFEDEIGDGAGRGYNVNIPLPAETYDEAFLFAFDRAVLPVLEAYAPDVLVLELGMDTLAGDPLTHLCLTNNAHAELIQRLLELKLPVLVTGGGGYNVEHTVRGWALAWRTFAGESDEDAFSLGLGGVMLGSSEWAGGLRDHVRHVSDEQRESVETELRRTIQRVTSHVFPQPGFGCSLAGAGKSPNAVDMAAGSVDKQTQNSDTKKV